MSPESPLFHWIVLPLVIFMARTIDMSLSTLRIVFVAQGRRRLAPLVGFFESLIWLVVIAQALKHLDKPLCVIAYAGGFAMGNLVGLEIEHRLAMGLRLLRIFPHGDDQPLVDALRAHGQGVTVFDGQGVAGPVKMLFTLVRRRDLPVVLETVRRVDPVAFLSIEDVRQAVQGTYLPADRSGSGGFLGRFSLRKIR